MTRASDLIRPLITNTLIDNTKIEATVSPPLIRDARNTPSKDFDLTAAGKPSIDHADPAEMPILRIHADGSIDSEPETEVGDEDVLCPQEPAEEEVPGDDGDAPQRLPCNPNHPMRHRVRGLPKPITPTRAQRDLHDLTHRPYEPWCEHCVRARAKNLPH